MHGTRLSTSTHRFSPILFSQGMRGFKTGYREGAEITSRRQPTHSRKTKGNNLQTIILVSDLALKSASFWLISHES